MSSSLPHSRWGRPSSHQQHHTVDTLHVSQVQIQTVARPPWGEDSMAMVPQQTIPVTPANDINNVMTNSFQYQKPIINVNWESKR